MNVPKQDNCNIKFSSIEKFLLRAKIMRKNMLFLCFVLQNFYILFRLDIYVIWITQITQY